MNGGKQQPWTLITGGAKRLGKVIALTLVKQALPVVIQYNTSGEEAEETVREGQKWGRIEALQGDFSTPAGLEKFTESYLLRYSETVNLINNVGNFLIAPLSQTSFPEWTALFQTNVHTPFYLSQQLLPSIKQFKGAIVNIGTAGIKDSRANSYSPAYNLTKFAMLGMTKSFAKEVAKDSVRVNMISPGVLDISVDLVNSENQYTQNLPMGRPATCQEVADMVAYILNEKNSYITGQDIEIAGGFAL